jgi:two-component system sensor histidine kinase CpxA
MGQGIKRFFSSISVKLFLWFWLVTIISISATRIISTQLGDNAFVAPIHKGDLRRLNNIVERFTEQPHASIQFFARNFGRFEHATIWLKDPETNTVISSRNDIMKELANYIANNNFTDVVSVQFSYARLTGPLPILIEQKPYLIYYSTRTKHPPFGMFIMNLPKWARIAIPASISFILCWLLAQTFSRPLARIQKAAKQIGSGDLSTRLGDISNRADEFGQLASAFNQMASQLEKSVSAQQRLLGDVSHELRSPLTRLQLALALAQKSANSPEDLQKYLARSESEISKLDEMIGSVLRLSRLENAQQTLAFYPVDVAEFLQSLIDDAQFIANEKQITISLSCPNNIIVHIDQILIASAISNVLLNAVKYCPEQSAIEVNVSLNQTNVIIVITDQGGGVPESELSHLFEPFYRVNSSRERKTGGTGLGLAIAKQAIMAHSGRIYAKNQLNKNETLGLAVYIELPLNQN